MDKYLKIILEYSLEGRLADKDFLEKVVNIAVENGIIQKSVNEVHLINSKANNVLANFNSLDKTINCYSNSICEDIKKIFAFENKNIGEIEYAFYYNFTLLHAVLHELEHVHQHELILCSDKSIEGTIIKLFKDRLSDDISDLNFINFLKAIKEYVLYKKYYIYNPIERAAELKTCSRISELLELAYAIEEIEFEVLEKIYNKNLAILLINKKRGYTQIKDGILVGPLYTYLEKTKDKNKLKQLDIYNDDIMTFYQNAVSNYNVEERILYSLPVSLEERMYLLGNSCEVGINRYKRLKKSHNIV